MDQNINNSCWASSLGCCDKKISREHLVSAALFPNAGMLDVEGFEWCKGERKRVSVASLTSKILCQKHNNTLSKLDFSAGSAFNSIRESAALAYERKENPQSRYKLKKFDVNGFLLERWFLKTLINLSHGNYKIGSENNIESISFEELVRICYGKSFFPEKMGMYVASKVGAEISSKDEFGFFPLIMDGVYVVGGFFHFRGFLFFLSLLSEEIPNHFEWVPNLRSEWVGCTPAWRFKRIVITINEVKSHVIRFNWAH